MMLNHPRLYFGIFAHTHVDSFETVVALDLVKGTKPFESVEIILKSDANTIAVNRQYID